MLMLKSVALRRHTHALDCRSETVSGCIFAKQVFQAAIITNRSLKRNDIVDAITF
ncbi:hypothetical protein QEO94_08580 [Kingella negevensis]|uniref:hypothetical protein n=1 Tax=Kingella negevensis TaxID=1522312 RepID=UPI002543A70C|nr:hypothetical protein [Kingella negevensis]WII92683.1 hypothetical protein QEO94_08580 [Kingella negevensis]